MFPFVGDSPLVASASISIHSRAEDLFTFIGERFFANYPRWSPEVLELRQMGSGPVRAGTHARQVRIDHGHRSESTFAVVNFEPARSICFTGVSSPYRCDYEIKAFSTENSSRLVFTFELSHLELYLRPFERVIREAIKSGVEQTVRRLKCLVEADASQHATALRPHRIPTAIAGGFAAADRHP